VAVAVPCAGFIRQAGDVLARYDLTAPPTSRWELPKALTEISGLVVDTGGRVFAHADEQAIVFQLDPATRRVVKRFAFGWPAARGDFEAIALVNDRVVLVTSDGVLYSGPEGRDGEAVPFITQATGVGRSCEVEGLAHDPADRSLLLACKMPRVEALRGYLTVFRWPVGGRASPAAPRFRIPLSRVVPLLETPGFHPSDLARDPATGHFLFIAAQEQAIAELTPVGDVVRVSHLQRGFHRQPEGLAVTPDRALLVADEANGGRATLSEYRPAP
jgi:streptogramin lyase